jgi:hypothetical protein
MYIYIKIFKYIYDIINMSIYDNILVKISLFSVIYLLILITVSPLIDHIFTSLDEDIIVKENRLQILGEIIGQIVVMVVLWHYINLYVGSYLEKTFNIQIKVATKTAINVISSIALIGLQKNLIDKLEYITLSHPFRLADLFGN